MTTKEYLKLATILEKSITSGLAISGCYFLVKAIHSPTPFDCWFYCIVGASIGTGINIFRTEYNKNIEPN